MDAQTTIRIKSTSYINIFNLIGYLSHEKSYLLTNYNLQVPFDNIPANLTHQLGTFTYQVQQNFLTERQRSQQLEQQFTELQLKMANLKHQLHILRSSNWALMEWNR